MNNPRKKILIIDDDRDFAESIQTFLQLHGYDVEWADNGDDGVAVAVATAPDVILCDVMMGERTEGFFTVQQLRRTPGVEKTRIFMVSSVYAAVPAFQVEPDRSWLACDEFMRKPLDPDTLLLKIESGGVA